MNALQSVLVASVLAGLVCHDAQAQMAPKGASGSRPKVMWAPDESYDCKTYFSKTCPDIVVKVVPNSDPSLDQGGPGLCQGNLEYNRFIIHYAQAIFGKDRKIYWVIDKDSKKDFQFADTDAVVIDRNYDTSPQKKPAFVDGKFVDGKYKFHYKSTGDETLPWSDPGAPGFRVSLVRSSNGLACGKVDPPIVNQP